MINGPPVSRKVVNGRTEDTQAGRQLAIELTRGEASAKFEAMRDNIDKLTEVTSKNLLRKRMKVLRQHLIQLYR